jgi:hypothetical protein
MAVRFDPLLEEKAGIPRLFFGSVTLANGAGCSGKLRCRIQGESNTQLQRDALFDQCDPCLHSLVCGLHAELSAPEEIMEVLSH